MTFSDPSSVDKVLTLAAHELDGKKVSQVVKAGGSLGLIEVGVVVILIVVLSWM